MQGEETRTAKRTALFVLGARVLLLLAAAGLAAAGVAVALHDEAEAVPTTAAYACPMHPEVTAMSAGQCPICKMALEPLQKSKHDMTPAPVSGEHPPDCPMHPKRAPAASSSVVHTVVQATPTPPVGSSFATGVTWLPEAIPPAPRSRPSDRPVVDTPKRRVFVDDVRAPAWLETPGRLSVVLYRDELVGLSPGERGQFFRAAAPRAPLDVRLGDEAPTPWDASTSVVRFVVEPRPAGPFAAEAPDVPAALRPGEVGWLELPRRSRELLVFSESALLRSSEGPYVLVSSAGERELTRRPVEIGRILRGQVVVLSGLRESDRIVVSGAFLLDAENSREPGSGPLAGVGP